MTDWSEPCRCARNRKAFPDILICEYSVIRTTRPNLRKHLIVNFEWFLHKRINTDSKIHHCMETKAPFSIWRCCPALQPSKYAEDCFQSLDLLSVLQFFISHFSIFSAISHLRNHITRDILLGQFRAHQRIININMAYGILIVPARYELPYSSKLNPVSEIRI